MNDRRQPELDYNQRRLGPECLQCVVQRAQGQTIKWAPVGHLLLFTVAGWTTAPDWMQPLTFSD
jgi:hypothetical protein